MRKKLEKFEDTINKALLALASMLLALLHKVIPQIFWQTAKSSRLRFKLFIHHTSQKLINLVFIIKNHIIKGTQALMISVDKIQKFPLKDKIFQALKIIKICLLHTPFKNHLLWLNQKLNGFFLKSSGLVNKIGKQQLSIALGAMIMVGVGIVSIYDSSRQIYNQEMQGRHPASTQEFDEKPPYFMYTRKTALVLKVQIPIEQQSIKDLSNITIDFTVRTSTRFAKKYLEFHTQKLKDYFFTSVEPVIASFPLESEGKMVLKEKLLNDLNNFLQSENVEGIVEEVNLVYVVGY